MIIGFIHNAALLVTLVVIYEAVARAIGGQRGLFRVASGLLFGLMSVLVMMTPVAFAPGVIYDGRSIVLTLAGLFGGPVPAAIAAIIASAFRLQLGGAGALVGVGVVLEAAALGVAVHHLRRRDARWTGPLRLLALGVLVHAIMLAIQLGLPGGAGWTVVREIGPAVMIGFPLTFLLAAAVFLEGERRRNAAESLAHSESRYRSLFEDNHAVMLLIDPADATIADANAAAERFYGWSRAELRSMNVRDIDGLPPDDVRRIITSAHDDPHGPLLSRHRLADGSWRDVEVFTGTLDVDGRQLLYSIVHDVTQRVQAERRAERQRIMLARTEALAHVGSWEWEIGTDRVTWSDELFRIFGLEPAAEAPAFAEHQRAYLPEDRESLVAAVQRCASEGEPYELEVRLARPDGDVRTCIVSGRAERNGSGAISYVAGSLHDVTELRRAEQDQEKLRDQLLQAQKMESVGRLAGGVAHDFNNMLNVILGHADLALTEIDGTDPLHEHLEQITQSAQRSADLTRQLLAFARKQTATPRVLDLDGTVSSMLKMLGRLIGEDVELLWRPASDPARVFIDPAQVDQLLANLCVNARDAIGQGPGRISIETGTVAFDEEYCAVHSGFRPGEYVSLVVSDDGCGMDRDTLESIFEPFYTTKEPGEGTGLGLATVYGIVKQNEGFINVYSEPDQGTTFRIYLPRHAAGGETDAQATPMGAPDARGDETIMIVEDEAAILELTRTMLERHGYEVITAGTPSEAIRIARSHGQPIDLLITDVVMPEMNGRDLVEQALAHHPGLAHVFMSGYTADVIAHQGVLDEGVDFIQKPFSAANLAAKVREVLDRRR